MEGGSKWALQPMPVGSKQPDQLERSLCEEAALRSQSKDLSAR